MSMTAIPLTPAMNKPLARQGTSIPWGFPEFFIISQTVLPALLYLPGTQPIRVPIRVSAYAMSLVAMVIWAAKSRSGDRKHPSVPWLTAAVAYITFMIFHPTTNSIMCGMAQAGLYVAVLAPVFWAPSLVTSAPQLQRLLALLLICNGINSMVGIMQVYDPDRWMPKELTTMTGYDPHSMNYEDNHGKLIIRPSGLSDLPGAVCGPAATAGLLGLVFCANAGIALWQRLASLAFAFAGISALYLTQVRSSLVVLVISLIVYTILLFLQKERKRVASLLTIATAVIGGALVFAVFLGGTSILVRIASIGQEETGYKRSRGFMVEQAFEVMLFQYPVGAGLGRWGTMRTYFGDEANTDSPMIWAEIQWPAWILDGGVVLMGLYSVALIVATRNEWRLARRHRDPAVRSMAALVLATNLGTIALLFSYTPFCAPIGVQYWFLAGAVSGIARVSAPKRSKEIAIPNNG